jgi:hypothetical protein
VFPLKMPRNSKFLLTFPKRQQNSRADTRKHGLFKCPKINTKENFIGVYTLIPMSK